MEVDQYAVTKKSFCWVTKTGSATLCSLKVQVYAFCHQCCAYATLYSFGTIADGASITPASQHCTVVYGLLLLTVENISIAVKDDVKSSPLGTLSAQAREA
eukprot:1157627-Pelagomonas_calceolata.AAC.1